MVPRFVIVTLLCSARFAVADEPASPPSIDQKDVDGDAEVIEVRARWPDADLFMVADTTRATTKRKLPSDARLAVLADVLEGIPGVAVQRTGAGQGAPLLRGSIGSSVLIVVDGMRLNNAIFRPAPNQYTALVDPFNISQVEVTRGPGSALFGSDAVGGVINVISPLPRFDGEAWQRTMTAAVLAATADRSIVSRVAAATGRRGSGVSIGTTIQRHHDLRSGGGNLQTPSAYDSIAVDATGHVEYGKHATTAWLQLLEQPSLPRTDEMTAGFGQSEPAAAVFRYEPSRRSFAHVRHLLRTPIEPLDGIELHIAWQRIDDDRRIRDTGSDQELAENNHDDTIGVAARSVAPGFGGDITFGIDYWLDRVRSHRTARDIITGDVERVPGRFADGSTMHQLGSFGEARRKLGRVALRAAARVGVTRVEIPVADRSQGATINSANWAGELGTELTVRSGVLLAANVGRAFRSPNVHDLSGLGSRPGNRFQIPAVDLADEGTFGADVGLKIRDTRLDAELFGFALRTGGQIDVIPTGNVTPDGREIVASGNLGDVRLYGAECYLAWRATDDLQLDANATWVRGTQSSDAGREPADRVPAGSGRLGVHWLLQPHLRIDGAVRGALAQRRLSERDRGDPRIDPTGTPAFLTLHVGTAIVLGDFEIGLRLDNLLDRSFREHGSGTAAPGFDASVLVAWRYTSKRD